MVSRLPPSSSNSFRVIQEVIRMGEVDIPAQFNGTGAAGNTLEYLLDVERNNFDAPDLNDWEIKFHGGVSLLTLFHKEPQPRGIMNAVVNRYGWDDGHGRISFRHTIRGRSERGFVVTNADRRITVSNEADLNITPYWEHNTILGAIGAKLRRLIVVNGKVNNITRRVVYNSANAYWDLDLIGLCDSIQNGTILIDFDARTTRGRGTSLRNHGTKFRIDIDNIGVIYENLQIIV